MRRSVILLVLGTSALGLGQPALARGSVAGVADVGPVAFAPYQAYPVGGSASMAVAVGDFTGDGRNDVAMSTGFYFSPRRTTDRVWLFRQKPDGAL